MAKTNEKIADIIAEMRRGTRLPGYWRSCDVNEILQYHADRLEAAHKREKSAIEADALAVGGMVEAAHKRELSKIVSKDGADFGQLGDAAKLREALSDACYAMFNFLKTQYGGYEEMANALDKAKATLAEPPRNCDVGTGEEQARQFLKYCVKQDCEKTCPFRDCKNSYECSFAWAQMPYEEGAAS